MLLFFFCTNFLSSRRNAIGGDGSVPFALVFISAMMLPSQGFWNAILFVILLNRERKMVEQKKYAKDEEDAYAFSVEEIKLRVFGETICWYFTEEETGEVPEPQYQRINF